MGKERFLITPREDIKEEIQENFAITDSIFKAIMNSPEEYKMKIYQSESVENMKTFFKVLDRCSDNTKVVPTLPKCSKTSWSSIYPDPKSTINGVDPVTGIIL